MYSEQLEAIIDAALADGVLTDKEREVLHKRAAQEGIDADELDVVIDGRLAKMKKQEDWLRPAPPQNLSNEKLGNIVKCPNCGCTDVAGRAVCPECGYAFTNVRANQSALRLAEKLEKIEEAYRNKISFTIPLYGVSKKAKEIASTILNFPVPNTKDDLLEFLSSMHSKLNQNMTTMQVFEGQTINEAYKAKFKECVQKARISFANDPAFQIYFEADKSFFKKISSFFSRKK